MIMATAASLMASSLGGVQGDKDELQIEMKDLRRIVTRQQWCVTGQTVGL